MSVYKFEVIEEDVTFRSPDFNVRTIFKRVTSLNTLKIWLTFSISWIVGFSIINPPTKTRDRENKLQ